MANNQLSLFNIAQTFTVDPGLAANTTTIGISSINVYFKYKPSANNNMSQSQNPGITLYLCGTQFGTPNMTTADLVNAARCEYNSILTSSDATAPTNFRFASPIQVTPGQSYAFVLSYDFNETFCPWTASVDDWLVGTIDVFTGQNSPLVGQYFENASQNVNINQNQAAYNPQWTALVGTELTFDVLIARYYIDGIPVAFSNQVSPITPVYGNNGFQSFNANTGILTLDYPSAAMEAISFNLAQSTVQNFIGAQKVFQNTVSWPGGWANGSSSVTISATQGNTVVTANANYPNGTAFNWNTIYPGSTGNYIVLQDSSGPNCRKVLGIVSNTVIVVDEPVTFTNALATFMVTPIATVDSTATASPFGSTQRLLFCMNSTANGSVRFVNNSIVSWAANNGGSGYNNTDILYAKGFEFVANKVTGGYVAVANIVTNSTGGIVTIHQSNLGCGFVNSAAIIYVVANAANVGNTTGNTSSGSGATFTIGIGSTSLTEQTNNIFQNCVISNFSVDDVDAFFQVANPPGTNYSLALDTDYYLQVDTSTFSGFAYYLQQPSQNFNLTLSQDMSLISNTPVAFISRSNEFVTNYANGATNDQVNALAGYSNSMVLQLATQSISNDDYTAVIISSLPTVEFGHFIVNNNYYGENTNSGNSWARHLTTLINLNQFAEDIRVYLTVYQPINTSFAVFAKIQNANDPASFSSEDWTLLEQISGQGLVSSTSDQTDYVQLGYGFQLYPVAGHDLGANATVTFGNTVNTSNASNSVTTSGGFNSSVTANTMVRLYNPLFSNTDHVVALVSNVNSDTTLTLDQVLSSNVNIGGDPAIVANGLTMDIIGYPHQAFNNILNGNTVRYYDTSFMKFDGYNTLQIKVILMSNAFSYIPRIHNIMALSVTA